MYTKKNICPVCGRNVEYVKVIKADGKITHRAFHAGEVPAGMIVLNDIHDISPTYRKRLRDAIPHNGHVSVPVLDATGMNRIVMVTEAINIMKENGMSAEDATEMRKKMLAKGSNFQTDIELAAPYLKIVRN